jgi:hypothetical protein
MLHIFAHPAHTGLLTLKLEILQLELNYEVLVGSTPYVGMAQPSHSLSTKPGGPNFSCEQKIHTKFLPPKVLQFLQYKAGDHMTRMRKVYMCER